jgi:hypothetical protein
MAGRSSETYTYDFKDDCAFGLVEPNLFEPISKGVPNRSGKKQGKNREMDWGERERETHTQIMGLMPLGVLRSLVSVTDP